jgi:hypothetical protein
VAGGALGSFGLDCRRLVASWLVGSFIDREAGITQAAEFEAMQQPIIIGEGDARRMPDDQ